MLATGTYMAFWICSRGALEEPARGRGSALLFYVGLFLTAAVSAVRLGYPKLVLVGGLPVALVSVLAVHRLITDRQMRTSSIRRVGEPSRVADLAERRLATHRN